MGVHLEEFLYRGRPEGSTQEPAWHIILQERHDSLVQDGDAPVCKNHVLNMAQAEAAAWPLPKIIAAINAEVLKEHEALRATHQQLQEAHEALTARSMAPWPQSVTTCDTLTRRC